MEAGCLPLGLLLKHRSLQQAFEYPAWAGDITESVDGLLSTQEALSSIPALCKLVMEPTCNPAP